MAPRLSYPTSLWWWAVFGGGPLGWGDSEWNQQRFIIPILTRPRVYFLPPKPSLLMPGRPTAAKRAQSPRRSHHSPRRSIPYRPRPLPAFERPVISPEELATLPDILKEECGWEGELRPFQASTLEELAAGRDVVLHSATGSGKTLTLAALHKLPSTKGMVTLCASPLIALQDEQVRATNQVYVDVSAKVLVLFFFG